MEINVFNFVLLFFIIILSQTVETTTGFGSTVIALSLGALIFPMKETVILLVIIGGLQSLWIVLRYYKHIQWRILLWRIVPFCGLGLPIGIYFFDYLCGPQLKMYFGIFVVLVATVELVNLYRTKGATRDLPLSVGIALLLAGGIIHGIFASGGPLIVYYASRRFEEKAVFRATLSMLWLVLNSSLAINFAISRSIHIAQIVLAGELLPALFLGIIFGEILHRKVNEFTFRIVVQCILLLTGVFLLI
jgi:uncharacterized membrane protein YfcA